MENLVELFILVYFYTSKSVTLRILDPKLVPDLVDFEALFGVRPRAKFWTPDNGKVPRSIFLECFTNVSKQMRDVRISKTKTQNKNCLLVRSPVKIWRNPALVRRYNS